MPMRFRDWTELDTTERAQLSANSGEFARKLEPRLKAFVEFESEAICARGVLDAMPYAAKDIFVSAARSPHGGLAQPLLLARSPQATVLDQLDRAGARRIGFTAMTELAYEPSGYNAVAWCAQEPVELRIHPRWVVIWLGSCRRKRIRCFRAWIRHRRLTAHPGTLLRRHILEADLWGRIAGWRDATIPEPRYGGHPRP